MLALYWHSLLSLATFLQCIYATHLLLLARHRRLGSALALLYATVCCFRAFFPRVDAERLCFFNSPLSVIGLGRSAATVAEVSFGVLAALITQDGWAAVFTVVGNAFCWAAVLTRLQRLHALEELCWAVGALYVFVRHRQRFPWLWICLPFAAVIIGHDIPMYLRKAVTYDSVVPFVSLWHSFLDAWKCEIVSKSDELWKPEMVWMTPYFTLGVWICMYWGVLLDQREKEKQQKKKSS